MVKYNHLSQVSSNKEINDKGKRLSPDIMTGQECKVEYLREKHWWQKKRNHPKKRKTRKSGWSSEILDLIKERQQIMPRNGVKYIRLIKNIRNKCKQSKEQWLNEKLQNRNVAKMYRNIKEITKQKKCSSARCIKSKE